MYSEKRVFLTWQTARRIFKTLTPTISSFISDYNFFIMEQEKSFLEEDSFMDLPPLKRVDQSLALQELGTMFLCDDFGNEIKNQEFGRIMTINKSLTKYNFNFSILV